MPLYEYRCVSCGRVTEVMHRVNQPGPKTCEACGGEMQKMPSAPALQFKGSGFYITDYARGSGGSKGDSQAEAKESKPEAKPESKPESKPETKAPAPPTPASPAKKD
jgi:putative FmdB family regulatory protein